MTDSDRAARERLRFISAKQLAEQRTWQQDVFVMFTTAATEARVRSSWKRSRCSRGEGIDQ